MRVPPASQEVLCPHNPDHFLFFFPPLFHKKKTVAGVTALASLDTLSRFPPIKNLLSVSPVLTGIIQGLIPPMILSTLMSLLPLFLLCTRNLFYLVGF